MLPQLAWAGWPLEKWPGPASVGAVPSRLPEAREETWVDEEGGRRDC